MKLSVLDQSPVPEGADAGQALANTIDLARHADRLGYHRYWVAEHHNMDGLAGSSPEVLLGRLAVETDRIRVGSGGVMLSHYSSLKVAESFRVLHALHPGRIDLGLGRAPGSDPLTAAALARGSTPLGIEYYPNQVEELVQFLDGTIPPESPLAPVRATPRTAGSPEVWLLASSADSASYAAHFGLPLSWAHFISPDGAPIVGAYRDQYRASERAQQPVASIGISVICAETDDEATHLASSLLRWRAAGLRGPIPPPNDPEDGTAALAAAPAYQRNKPLIAGSPATVGPQIVDLAEQYGVDEVVIVTICHDHDARVRSYELLAANFELR